MNTYTIYDAKGIYGEATVEAASPFKAQRKALAVMMGCSLSEVEPQVVSDCLLDMWVSDIS